MKKKIILVFTTSLLIFVFLGCGGGGEPISYKEESLKLRSLTELQGVIVDGYISGASIRIEGTKSNSATSGKNGEYLVNISSNSDLVKIQAHGGIDKDTGDPFEGILRTVASPSDVIYTTPLTTLVSFLVDDGESLGDARRKVNSSLGFSGDLVLSKTDPFGDTLDNALKVKLFKTTQQVQKVSEILKDALGNNIGYDNIAKAITKTISENAGSANSVAILNSDALIESVVSKVVNNKDRTLSKLNAIKIALHQMVNTIESISSIEYSKHIHLISSIYEKQSNSISDAIDNGDSTKSLETDMQNLTNTLKDMSKVDSFMKAIGETPNSSLVDFLIKKVIDSGKAIDIGSVAIQNEAIGKKTPVKTPTTSGGGLGGSTTTTTTTTITTTNNKACSEHKGLTPPTDDCKPITSFPSFVD